MAGYKKENRDRIEHIYSKYPKKMGKSRGVNSALAQCKTSEDLDLLEKAISNYIDHLARESTERQFIMYFSTFMSQWRDWLEIGTGTTIVPKLDLSDIGFEK